jgi:LmbE family N-acetylglucosaminyl deacetylase
MSADPVKEFEGIVVITVPHMDDEVLACGRTIASLPDKERIHFIYATDGSKSPVPMYPWSGSNAPDLPSIRREEAKAALGVLGIPENNLHFLDFPDSKLKHHGPRLCERLAEFFERLKPSCVLAPFRYDRHPDHLALNRAATRVLQRNSFQVDLIEYFVYYRWALLPGRDIRQFIRPDNLIKVDIQEQALQKKQAIDCYKSQTTLFYAWQDRPILPPQRVAEVSRSPEYFLRYDPRFPTSTIFTHSGAWIRMVHLLEPSLKSRKDQLCAFFRMGRPRYGR